MELSTAEWAHVQRIALAEARRRCHHNPAFAEDLAAAVVEKLLRAEPQIKPGGLDAYVRAAVLNTYLDDKAKADAAMRGGSPLQLDELTAEVAQAILDAVLISLSPSAIVIRRQREQSRMRLYLEIVDGLPPRKRELVLLAAQGLPQAEIAERLGYASADSVKTTLNRIYKEIRSAVEVRGSDLSS